jgi:hypothetical protein
VLLEKSQINFGVRCPDSILSCQHLKNNKRLKMNHFETQINAQNNKRQNLIIKTAAAWRIFLPPLNMLRIFIFLFR